MPFASTKFHIPGLSPSSTVLRTGLLESMEHAQTKSLIMVSAPAGFGKTTFLSQWILCRNLKKNCAWVSLDTLDNRPPDFWLCLIEAIHRTIPGLCNKVTRILKSRPSMPFENILVRLINCLESLDSPLILALDDYHVITDPVIHNSLNFLIDHPIDRFCLVISSREDPPLGLSRLRAGRNFMEIRQQDLRFSRLETVAFINDVEKLHLEHNHIDHLNQKTEGWIAGLKLAALSIRNSPDPMTMINTFSGNDRFVFDFLMEEVLVSLPEDTTGFLKDISVTDRFCTSLCQAVSGTDRAALYLKTMEQNNLFMVPLDNTRTWFRFHHLFGDFLRRLGRKKSETPLVVLHENAYYWFFKHHYYPEAFSHAVCAENYKLAASALKKMLVDLFKKGGEQSISPYLDRLPEKTILSDPQLWCYYFWCNMLNGDFSVAHKIQPLLDETSETNRSLAKGFHKAFMAYQVFFQEGDLVAAIGHSTEALKMIPKRHYTIRRIIEHIQAISYRFIGELEMAFQLSRIKPSDDFYIQAMSTMVRADVEFERGNLASAFAVLNTTIHSAVDYFGENIPDCYGFVFLCMGNVFREMNRLEESGQMILKGLSLGEKMGYIEFLLIGYIEYTKYLMACQEFQKAHDAMDTAIEIAGSHSSSWAYEIGVSYKARIYLMQGNFPAARKWAESFSITSDTTIDFIRSIPFLNLARYYISAKLPQKALIILDKMIDQDIELKRYGRLLECYILKASACFAMQQEKQAVILLEAAFALSAKQGHVRLFLDEWPSLESLFLICHKTGTIPKYLLPHVNLDHQRKSGSPQTCLTSINNYTETFNTRELQILQCMQQGASNLEIADNLFLSVNTVRWYASRLFAKLGAKRRGEAVSRALNLKLI